MTPAIARLGYLVDSERRLGAMKDSSSHDRHSASRACWPITRLFAEQQQARTSDVWTALVELGVPGVLVDEAHGGSGLGALEAALVAECLGRRVAPVPYVASCVLAPLALKRAGCRAQCAQWLPKLASGTFIAGAALAELCGAREDAGVSHAGETLRGRALFVLDYEADMYLVATRDGKLFLVAHDAAGLTRRALHRRSSPMAA